MEIRFTITESNGDMPISAWFASRLIRFAQDKYGKHLIVQVVSPIAKREPDVPAPIRDSISDVNVSNTISL